MHGICKSRGLIFFPPNCVHSVARAQYDHTHVALPLLVPTHIGVRCLQMKTIFCRAFSLSLSRSHAPYFWAPVNGTSITSMSNFAWMPVLVLNACIMYSQLRWNLVSAVVKDLIGWRFPVVVGSVVGRRYSVQFKMVLHMRWEKLICAQPCLSEVSRPLPLKQCQW